MAGRGSGIGQSAMGGLGINRGGGSQTSTRPAAPGQLYGPRTRGGVSNLAVHHWLWILVAIEIAFLALMRVVVFKNYHGG